MRKQLLTLIGATLLSLSSIAQTEYVHQVIILNEGQYDYTNQVQITPVSIGSYDPSTDTYTEFDQIIGAKFGSDVLVDGDFIYVAADSAIYKYDKKTLTLSNSTTVEGIRKMAIWNNQILVTIGESVPHNAYFRVFDKNTLSFIYELDTLNGPSFSSEGVVVLNDTAYIAVNNSFEWGNGKGLIGLVDLNNQSYMTEIDITPDGLNPDNLMISGTRLYTLNNMDWTNSSITEFNCLDRTFSTTMLSAPSGCGASAFADNNIFYHRYDYDSNWTDTNATLNLFNISNQIIDTIYPDLRNVYGMVNDENNSQFYLTTTDFWSFGKAYIMDYTGLLTDSFDVGISAGNLALDIRSLNTASTETTAACDSYTWNGNIFTISGTYMDTIPNAVGGDSVMTLILTINTVDVTVTNNDPTLVSSDSTAVYQWIDCGNGNAPIAGATNQSYTATGNGSYAVMITQNGCTDTSACLSVLTIGFAESIAGSMFSVFPNPSSSILYIEVKDATASYEVIITDIAGRQVYTDVINKSLSKSIDIENWPNGVYMLYINSKQGGSTHKIVKY
ncbi:T9SS type A sorting domain-containing protein [Flavobacteriales bacterium AH-315-E23]|nr:T9SS type A sorting domain-containing protein [Flavobacteriales bacterium AH-315-E23]